MACIQVQDRNGGSGLKRLDGDGGLVVLIED